MVVPNSNFPRPNIKEFLLAFVTNTLRKKEVKGLYYNYPLDMNKQQEIVTSKYYEFIEIRRPKSPVSNFSFNLI